LIDLQVSTNLTESGNSTAELRIIQKTTAHRSAITSLFYVTLNDTQVTASMDGKVGVRSDVTRIPYTAGLLIPFKITCSIGKNKAITRNW
jgi:hypothetical protein